MTCKNMSLNTQRFIEFFNLEKSLRIVAKHRNCPVKQQIEQSRYSGGVGG